MLTWCCSEYCVPSRLDFKAAGGCAHCTMFVQLFALSALSWDMGAFSWLIVETIKRAPTLHFGRLVRSSTHGRSFTRLQYSHFQASNQKGAWYIFPTFLSCNKYLDCTLFNVIKVCITLFLKKFLQSYDSFLQLVIPLPANIDNNHNIQVLPKYKAITENIMYKFVACLYYHIMQHE